MAVVALTLAACGGGAGPTTIPTGAGTAAPTGPATQAATPAAATTVPLTATPSPPASALQTSFCQPWNDDVVNHWPPFEVLEAEKITTDLQGWIADPAFASVAEDMRTVIDYVAFVMHGGNMRPPTDAQTLAFTRIGAFALASC